jgi:uncharacterized protein (DUF1684 family)
VGVVVLARPSASGKSRLAARPGWHDVRIDLTVGIRACRRFFRPTRPTFILNNMSDDFALPALSPLDVADWRIRTFALYELARIVAETDPYGAHVAWGNGRDEMFLHHPASPLLDQKREDFHGLTYFEYDPTFRFEVPIEPAEPETRDVTTGTDGTVTFERVGVVRPAGIGSLDVWRVAGYGGGIFIPVKDALAGKDGGTYGAGRYLIDTIKGAHLGTENGSLILDLNFAYNPSCVYDPRWLCPLAGAGNTVGTEIAVGERIGRSAA